MFLSELERRHLVETLQAVLAESEYMTPSLVDDVEQALASLGVVVDQEDGGDEE